MNWLLYHRSFTAVPPLLASNRWTDPNFASGYLASLVSSSLSFSRGRALKELDPLGRNLSAVGSVPDAGHIALNYVSPDARFRGVSRALLGALEARAMERGSARCTLNSTETARAF
jgi:GNAT superfamily N-acetyltransferase